ncbi:LutC/YkgG family protein [Flavitalea antarctica]
MASRDVILNSIRRINLEKVEISNQPRTPIKYKGDLLSGMIEKLLSIGAEVLVFENDVELGSYVNTNLVGKGVLVNSVPTLPNDNVSDCMSLKPTELSSVKIFITKGSIGVTESGAVWVEENSMKLRLLPFVCEHLYLVLNEQELVFDLDEAYQKIGKLSGGYGVFIAGPSKTADIEQSLVIGAHGPIKLTVLFVRKHP